MNRGLPIYRSTVYLAVLLVLSMTNFLSLASVNEVLANSISNHQNVPLDLGPFRLNDGVTATRNNTISVLESVREFDQRFKEIIIDVRGNRAGSGDVAAGYLTAMDLILNFQIKGSITFLVDGKSRKVLDRIAHGNSTFFDSVQVQTLESIPGSITFDLYLALASPVGSFRYGKQIDERSGPPDEPESGLKINMNSDGILLVQTVFGNTEKRARGNPYAVIRGNGINYLMNPAGIAANEAGIYKDFIASRLRLFTSNETKAFILSESEVIPDSFSKYAVQSLLTGSKLIGSKIGLAYGISYSETWDQFESYLQGLANETSGAFSIITPSEFLVKNIINPELQNRIVVISDQSQIPTFADDGKIYILKVKTLPHKVFVGLIAYCMKSGLVPVGAGDGFLSAAINLGGPFVLTQVPWNEKNLDNISERMGIIAKKIRTNLTVQSEVLEILFQIFEAVDLTQAQSLQSLNGLFFALDEEVSNLTEQIIDAVVQVARAPEVAQLGSQESYSSALDFTLRKSIQEGGTLYLEDPLPKPEASFYSKLKGLLYIYNSHRSAMDSKLENIALKPADSTSDPGTVTERASKLTRFFLNKFKFKSNQHVLDSSNHLIVQKLSCEAFLKLY